MSKQNELKQQYKEELEKLYGADNWRVDYTMKGIQRVVELSDGSLYAINKQRIETSFCYGYGWSGISTIEEHEEARDMAAMARTNEDYFIEENMKEFSPFDRGERAGQKVGLRGDKLKSPVWSCGRPEYDDDDFQPISKADEAILRQAYEEEKAVHLKKIQSYLKRYGLSKVRSWSYLVD